MILQVQFSSFYHSHFVGATPPKGRPLLSIIVTVIEFL